MIWAYDRFPFVWRRLVGPLFRTLSHKVEPDPAPQEG